MKFEVLSLKYGSIKYKVVQIDKQNDKVNNKLGFPDHNYFLILA